MSGKEVGIGEERKLFSHNTLGIPSMLSTIECHATYKGSDFI